jgi:outer membrane protein
MKKLILALAVVAISAQAFSQMFVGGSFGVSFDKHKDETYDISKSTEFSLAPKVGYYLDDKLAFGAHLAFETGSTTYFNGDADDSKSSSNLITLAPFVRYHFMELGNLSIFAEPTLSLGFGGEKTEVGGNTTRDADVSRFGLYVVPAMAYKVNDKIDIEAFFGYFGYMSRTEKEGDNKDTYNSFGLNLTSGLSLGFTYKF